MQINVSGHQVDVGDSLREHAEERLERSVTKYFEHAIFADVVFSKEAHLFVADIHVNEGIKGGIMIKAQGKSEDSYAAFDEAAERIESQLRRYKTRITSHKGAPSTREAIDAVKYVIKSDETEEEAEENPIIIAENEAHIETLTVGEAVMRMDLASLPALLFINSANARLNVVYKRKDGNISWVDPKVA